MQGLFNIQKSKTINVVHHINRLKKNLMILTDAGKACDKIQHTFIIKTLSKVSTEENFLNIYKNLTASIIFMGKKLQRLFHYDQEQGKVVPSHHSFSRS